MIVVFEKPTEIRSTQELCERFNSDGLMLAAGASVLFEGRVALSAGVEFGGHCQFLDRTTIGAGSILTDVQMGHGNVVRPYSLISTVVAGDRNLFGPFCFIRDQCRVEDDCILGAHVEAARSCFGNGVKISHRAFIGDATIGDRVIIGAGVVFCNYDGVGRQPTDIQSGATIGSGSLLVPPLTIGENAIIAAGSTVTRDVPADAKIIQKR